MIPKLALALLAAAALPAVAAAQAPATPLFASDGLLHLTIRGPVSAIADGQRREVPRPATLSVAGGETLPVTLTPRGITRLSHDICQFPPLRVAFAGRPAAPSLFAGQNKLKLVTHCRNAESFQQHLLLEYAAYRMFNQLTPRSLRLIGKTWPSRAARVPGTVSFESRLRISC